MTDAELNKECENAMRRMADRLVELGFAKFHYTDAKNPRGTVALTESGLSFQGYLKRFFDVPNVSPQEISGIDIFAVVQVLLILKPVEPSAH